MVKLKGSLRKLLQKRGQPKIFKVTTPLPTGLAEVNKVMAEENAELRARILDYESRDEDKEIKKERIREEEKEKEIVLKYEERQKKKSKLREMKFIIEETRKNPPTFYLKNDIPYCKFLGFMSRETEEGHVIWYPLLEKKDKKGNKRLIIPHGRFAYADTPLDIFKKQTNIVSQIRGGKVDSNYDMTYNPETGRTEINLYVPKYVTENGTEVEKIDISDIERKELETRIKELELAINQLYFDKKKFQEREIKYKTQLADLEITNDGLSKESDIWRGYYSHQSQKVIRMIETLASTLSGLQDLRITSILTEDMNQRLIQLLGQVRSLWEKEIPKIYIPKEEHERGIKELENLEETIHGIVEKVDEKAKKPEEKPEKGRPKKGRPKRMAGA